MKISRHYVTLGLLMLLISCAPLVYTSPDLGRIESQELSISFDKSTDDIWPQLLDYLSRSSYGVDSVDTTNQSIQLHFRSLNFHRYLKGGYLDEGGFNGHEGDYLHFLVPTDDLKSQLDCDITVDLKEQSSNTSIIQLQINYSLKRFKNAKRTKLLDEWAFSSTQALAIESPTEGVSYYIIPSFLLEQQLLNSFQLFSE